jgi:hypothetical protein
MPLKSQGPDKEKAKTQMSRHPKDKLRYKEVARKLKDKIKTFHTHLHT